MLNRLASAMCKLTSQLCAYDAQFTSPPNAYEITSNTHTKSVARLKISAAEPPNNLDIENKRNYTSKERHYTSTYIHTKRTTDNVPPARCDSIVLIAQIFKFETHFPNKGMIIHLCLRQRAALLCSGLCHVVTINVGVRLNQLVKSNPSVMCFFFCAVSIKATKNKRVE